MKNQPVGFKTRLFSGLFDVVVGMLLFLRDPVALLLDHPRKPGMWIASLYGLTLIGTGLWVGGYSGKDSRYVGPAWLLRATLYFIAAGGAVYALISALWSTEHFELSDYLFFSACIVALAVNVAISVRTWLRLRGLTRGDVLSPNSSSPRA